MRSLDQFIASDLLREARKVQELTTSLRRCLPSALAEHCWAGGYRGDTLTVITDGNVWSTALHYRQREMLARINADFDLNLARVRIKIANGPMPKPV